MFAVESFEISKHYKVYARPFDRLKEAITGRPLHGTVTALENVSFQLPFGGTLGIIGENGAGKSTLLKILAGTTRPTSGNLVKRGRIAALLELGSGFNPEFTGRVNIHLNAALLGLSEKDIRQKEPEIISFSELEDEIDRPVKTYSSGMHMRLAFSIATSVEPDVLVVDEALAVGDQRFQQKCVERMIQFRKEGKALLLCSHSMYLINELCEQTAWIDKGRLRSYGKTSEVIAEYLSSLEKEERKTAEEEDSRRIGKNDKHMDSGPEVLIEDVIVVNKDGEKVKEAEQFQTISVHVKTRRIGPPFKGHMAVGFIRPDGQLVFGTTTKLSDIAPFEFAGEQITALSIESLPFVGGKFRAKAIVADRHTLRTIDERNSDMFSVKSDHPEFGLIWIAHAWKFGITTHRSAEGL